MVLTVRLILGDFCKLFLDFKWLYQIFANCRGPDHWINSAVRSLSAQRVASFIASFVHRYESWSLCRIIIVTDHHCDGSSLWQINYCNGSISGGIIIMRDESLCGMNHDAGWIIVPKDHGAKPDIVDLGVDYPIRKLSASPAQLRDPFSIDLYVKNCVFWWFWGWPCTALPAQ